MSFNQSLRPILYSFFAFVSIHVFSQEQLVPLSTNRSLQSYNMTKQPLAAKTTSVAILDTIPFFDDFSYAYKYPYPNTKHWQDSSVYINTGFGRAPVSIGVATFDGLNKYGYPYNINASINSSTQADKLTSRPINLEKKGSYVYSPSDSIYLSFYYQAKGNGEAPEVDDSLVVDFFKPRQNKWTKVWGHIGFNTSGADTSFHMVMIPVKDTAYFDSLFVFRFRNKATVSGSFDHWNIDYVYMNRNRFYTDTTIDDLAFVYKQSSFLKNYSVMPYRQFIPSEVASNFSNIMRSNFTTPSKLLSDYSYRVFDSSHNLLTTQSSGAVGSPGIQPFKNNGYFSGLPHSKPSIPSTVFPFPLTGPTFFTIEHSFLLAGIAAGGDVVRSNDTITHKQVFSDYYAYDDGTAERAYQLVQTLGAKLAVRYTINVQDTLRALSIYFDPVGNVGILQNSSFRINVWSDGGGQPGTLLYRDSIEKNPVFLRDSVRDLNNLAPTYTLTNCLPLSPGNYYFGIQQNASINYNIGFDINTSHVDAIYYDIGSGWTQSTIAGGGSLMINPIMGCTVSTPVAINEYGKQDLLKLYPNPAQDQLIISGPDQVFDHTNVLIISTLGQTVYNTPFVNNANMDISHIPNGIYFVYLTNSKETVSPKKLIISR